MIKKEYEYELECDCKKTIGSCDDDNHDFGVCDICGAKYKEKSKKENEVKLNE
jgi:rRNA maturation endonuclease Nob1